MSQMYGKFVQNYEKKYWKISKNWPKIVNNQWKCVKIKKKKKVENTENLSKITVKCWTVGECWFKKGKKSLINS